MGDKTKAITLKFDIAKFMGEIIKHNGDIDRTLDDPAVGKATKLDITALKKQLNDIVNEGPEQYNLKNTNK